MRVSFTIPGEPKGKQRPRITKTGHAFTPEETVLYENLVKVEYQRQCHKLKFQGPLIISIAAYFGIPKSACQAKRLKMLKKEILPTKKPDMDNIIKIITDSLNKIAYEDDSQIVAMTASKTFSDNPRVEVIIIGKTV